MTVAHWEHFAHEADMGVRGYGATEAQAFEQAALALTAAITEPERVELREQVQIACEAPDDELLFVDWLNAIIFEMSTRKMLFARFEVRIENGQLTATIWGEKTDVAKHSPAVEAKGATYTALRVARENGQWIAQTVVDV
ncbi:MAG: archease [Pseudomonadota bacterium]